MTLRPVVKWAGGKSRLLDRLLTRLPPGRFEQYAEPFVGGAAMFFALAGEKRPRFDSALLSDKNAELVTLYQVIKNDVEPLIDRLRTHRDDYLRKTEAKRRDYFYEVRAQDVATLDPVERGARLLFLNKTCFNGLWRVNAAGRFNVPFGKYEAPKILDADVLRAAHEALAVATIVNADFSDVTKRLKSGDFVYFDPPYVPVSKTSNFTAYASDRFGPDEQKRLAEELVKLKKRGVKAMLSNAATSDTIELYAKHGFEKTTTNIRAARSINSDPSKRGAVDELVVTTYPVRELRVPAPAIAKKKKAAAG